MIKNSYCARLAPGVKKKILRWSAGIPAGKMPALRKQYLNVYRSISVALVLTLLPMLLALIPNDRSHVVPAVPSSPTNATNITHTIYLPSVMKNVVSPSDRLCRFGVGATQNIGAYSVNSLRLGWYLDWGVTQDPDRPGDISYVPIIRLEQTGADTYSYDPGGDTLAAAVAANPGTLWIIGNEPDRRDWQDSLDPDVYADAYHELYYLIKGLDPSARIAGGSIVQPTPLRLQYLDMVLESYRSQYGGKMPVDLWNIHAFILRERSCDYYPDDCWGAEIPPGIDAKEGMLYDIDDNDDIEIFKQHIQWFRQWMADNGYQNRPLIITEFGVQMWPDLGFPPEDVNAFMDATFDYLSTATSTLGYPADDYRLVQRWAWYSLADDNFNGWLFNPETKARTVFGDNFAAYTAEVEPTVNLAPVKVWTESPIPFSSGQPVTITLHAGIVNNGNVATTEPILVHIYEGNPTQGGTRIASRQISSTLDGCASVATIKTTWSNVSTGAHSIYVEVDPQNSVVENDEQDNTYSATVLVATSRLWLPIVRGTTP